MDVRNPLVLLLLLPLAFAVQRVGRERLRRLPWLRALATLSLRLLITALLVFALAGPRVTQAASGVQVVFVLDQSAGISPAGHAAAQAWIAGALQGRHAGDGASIVAIGKQPAWSGQFAGKTLPTIPPVDATGSNIDTALRLALNGLPANRSARLVLLSDGRQTSGDALQAAQQAALAGVPISVVPIPTPPRGDMAVSLAELPRYAHSGEHMTLRVGLQADRATTALVRLSVDGAPLGQRSLVLHAGLNMFFFAQTAGAPGTHVYQVQVQAPGDPVRQNNLLDAVTVVDAAPRILVLAGTPTEAAPLVQTLRSANLQIDMLDSRKAPTTIAGLSGYDAVVLADAPASALPSATVAAIKTAVHDRGMGLLVTGGAQSFAVGGYAGSGLESVLPVTSLAVAHAGRGNVALILIIDKSGSMMDEASAVSKISMAQQAAIDAISHLQDTDSFGVISFDDTTHVTVPFAPVGNSAPRGRERAAILHLQAFGNTVIYPALRQAARYLFASKAPFKHIVLMTDGQGETSAPFLQLIKQMKGNNITLSTIAIGSDAETDELQSWAAAGGGRYYFTADPHDIPRLVVLETRISSGPTRVQGTLGIRQTANDPALRSLVGTTLPSLHSYNIVAPKDTAQVLLQSQLGDPILAQWHYGLGQVTAWTGGITADWAQSWLKQDGFWSDVVHGLVPAAGSRPLQPDLQLTDAGLSIGADSLTPQGAFANLVTTRAEVTAPNGQSRTISLPQDAPGHYSITLPNPIPGVYSVNVAQYDNATLLRQSQGAIAVPYAAEYLPGDQGQTLLAGIAAAGNAPALAHPADAFSTAGLRSYDTHRDIWPLLALLALLLFPIDVAGRVLYTPAIPYDPERLDGQAARKV
jgi:Ca-activated chloride channel family protein